jgi:Tol biopolymer transport system component
VFPAIGEDGLTRYWIRSLDGIEARALPGTETVDTAPPAAWSFDSRWVLFTASVGGKLEKVDIEGGPPQNIGDFPGPLNGAGWNSAGVIVAGSANPGYPILRADASGGQATPITILAPGDVGHIWPQFLPDGKHFLYERVSSDVGKTGVYVGSIDAQPNQQSTQRLLASDRQAYYAPTPRGKGYLIFLRQATLMAQVFDPDNLKLSGEPVAIANGIDSYAAKNYGLFSVSNIGTLVYRGVSGPQVTPTWFDPQGNPVGTIGGLGDYSNPAISPDGGRIAVTMGQPAKQDIWILDGARGTNTRFTFDANSVALAWSPDSKNIAFSSNRGGHIDLYVKASDSSGDERTLLKTGEQKYVETWTRDGRYLVFDSLPNANDPDLWAFPFSGDGKAVPLVKTHFLEGGARVSPDGRWMAYVSNESGGYEIYVRPFTPEAPGTGAKWLVSKGAASLNPLWRPDGKVLFYLSSTLQAMAVDIETSKGFQAGAPRRMFAAPPQAADLGWDIAPNGKRFLFIASPGAGRTIPFTVVVNWQAGLK